MDINMVKSNGINLTDEEILILNNLTYLFEKLPSSKINDLTSKRLPVKDLIKESSFQTVRKKQETTIWDGGISGKEWADMIDEINNNPKFDEIIVGGVSSKNNGVGAIYFTDRDEKNAIVVFGGTGDKEWLDNFEGGYLSDTKAQKEALEWFEKLTNRKGEKFEYITLSGHSKGGNKAKYITIKSDNVDRCLSFNGQGFSPKFIRENKTAILKNRGKITSYSLDKDFVNVLLFDIGEKKFYIKGHGVDNFIQNHTSNSFLNKDMKFDFGNQDKTMKEIHNFITIFINTVSDVQIKVVLDYLGNIFNLALGEHNTKAAIAYALNPANAQAAAIFLTYALRYQELSDVDIVAIIKYLLSDIKLLRDPLSVIFDAFLYLFSDNETVMLAAHGIRTAALFGIEKEHTDFFDKVVYIATHINIW